MRLPIAMPDPAGLTREQRDDLAAAYLDLLSMLNEAINGPHGTAFVTWNGRGYDVSDHYAPEDS